MTTRIPSLLLALGAGLAFTTGTAHAAKQWDPYTAITFSLDATDDAIAPSNVGDNGVVTQTWSIQSYKDVDHWIDPDESAPNNEDHPSVNLPYSDIDLYTDATASPPGGLSLGASSIIYTAPSDGGEYTIKNTATDRDQAIGKGEGGNRNDPNDNDYWWTEIDPNEV